MNTKMKKKSRKPKKTPVVPKKYESESESESSEELNACAACERICDCKRFSDKDVDDDFDYRNPNICANCYRQCGCKGKY